jgi:uncharacterized RDD family membrane protein YckC
MNWFYVEAGRQAGPVDEAQLETLRQAGKIQNDTLVWREGMANWQRYDEVQPGAAPASTPRLATSPAAASETAASQAACAECHRVFDTQDMIRHGSAHVCAGCKPVFLQKLAEGVRVGGVSMVYAGFWIRVGAKLLDGLIVGIPLMAPLIYFAIKSANEGDPARYQVIQIVLQLVYMLGNMIYNIYFIGKYAATPGKMICKLRVVTADGGKVGYGRATGRFFAEMLSGMVCYIGYIMVAFDQERRALHDYICNTRVIHR